MRVIAKSTLRGFYEQPNYQDSQSALESWHHEVLKADWSNPNEIKIQYYTLDKLSCHFILTI